MPSPRRTLAAAARRHTKASPLRWLAAAVVGGLVWGCGQPLPPRTDEPSDAAVFADGPPPPHVACEHRDPLRKPFFGDTHVHTSYSFDASAQDTRNAPFDAYRFAKGERLGLQPYDAEGNALRSMQLDRPLDFVAVTDHAELLGEVDVCMHPEREGYSSWVCWLHRNWPSVGFQLISGLTLVEKERWGLCGEGDRECLGQAKKVWVEIQRAAEQAYDRSAACSFTSFVGYEWTATVGEGQNLHRNVVFASHAVPDRAISWVETQSALELWQKLQTECIDGLEGCDVLTIPHNSNLSGGLMFESAKVDAPGDTGPAVTAEEAKLRERWEPLMEIMQHKGDSECDARPDRNDEQCAFEKLPYDRFGAKFSSLGTTVQRPPRKSHVRDGLGRGLQQWQSLGVNGLKFGIVGATDTHIAAPGLTSERDHPGHGGAGMGQGEGLAVGFPDDLEYGPGGLSVLWAEENTRESLFAAMTRREAYGTSGTRPIVRLFGGWGYEAGLCGDAAFVTKGYAEGVPMGGDLAPRPGADATPRFAFRALGDAGTVGAPGTPLQRLQIVKVWIEGGEVKEKVYDVAGRENGASVDLDTCEPRGDGYGELCTVWTDPDFDPEVPALWYGRVLENPTCRWSQYVCNEAGVVCSDPATVPEALEACCSDAHRAIASQQERAWTSPIWYTPSS